MRVSFTDCSIKTVNVVEDKSFVSVEETEVDETNVDVIEPEVLVAEEV